jgi:RNA polymerase sigma factor (sigma-70 family)
MTEPSDDQLRELGTIAFRIAYRLLGSTQDAEDVAQEAVTRTAIRWRRVHGYAEAFTARIATNLAIGLLRKRRDVPLAADQAERVSVGQTADRVDLVRALRGISGRQRDVIVLRFIGDYSERDIASTLGCSPGSVKKHCARGLAALRLALTDETPAHHTLAEGALDAN